MYCHAFCGASGIAELRKLGHLSTEILSNHTSKQKKKRKKERKFIRREDLKIEKEGTLTQTIEKVEA